MINNFDETIKKELTERLKRIEDHLDSDVVFFFGPIEPGLEKVFRDFIETLKEERVNDKLSIIVNTPGGSAETVEKMVAITRHHYQTVDFIVPDSAMSAGTIFCMSGDNIYMDYSASLGPIDPQVYNGHRWVPALGYLDKFEELVDKSSTQPLSQAEMFLLQQQDMAMLTSYEQARDLTVSLLKQWLVEYKFKNWDTHASTGAQVTRVEKEERAGEIARLLGDNRRWHSHGRAISMKTLQDVLKLKIIDFGQDQPLKILLRDYNDMLCEYIRRHNNRSFLHSRVYF